MIIYGYLINIYLFLFSKPSNNTISYNFFNDNKFI